MKLLLIGSGAREHAIAWKLAQSRHTGILLAAPGNAGTVSLGRNLPVSATDVLGLRDLAQREHIDLTVVGPEAALEVGVVDAFQSAGLLICGPTKAAAQLETSKVFAKEFMARYHIPTASAMAFDDYNEALHFLESHDGPIVVKADGLTAGKGVTVAKDRHEALAALDAYMNQHVFGDSGARVVIEEFMEGREVSVFAFTDGERIAPLVAACDYKRAYDNDLGPNTGGMGSYSPPESWDEGLQTEVYTRFIHPTIEGMAREGRSYRGVLYCSLMLTKEGPKVVEFNARLGDPEAQVVLPRLKSDLVELAQAIAEGDISHIPVRWDQGAAVGVVVASAGYPSDYRTGYPIQGLKEIERHALVFHAGTKLEGEAILTAGGRVLTVVGTAPTLAEARQKVYASVQKVHFENVFYRKDIALRAIS
ncbi:MAG: phosphoribosylamine--glycine ligase [Chloroflexi bacterium]|nr:phosphoribosylamine--glycine ligase [Chloroflexota bacterium]